MKYLKTAFTIAVNLIFGIFLAAGVAMVLLRIFSVKLLAVETGSMGQEYPVGSLVAAMKCQPEEIVSGDVIAFVANEQLVTVTHRVIETDSENRCFYTKGDANNTPDGSPVKFENLVGKVIFKIPKAGYLVIWSHTMGGKIFISLIFVFIAVCIAGKASYTRCSK
jgi:signal peptidase